MLFLHSYGPGTTAWITFHKTVGGLSQHFRCILMDLPNFSETGPVVYREGVHAVQARTAVALLCPRHRAGALDRQLARRSVGVGRKSAAQSAGFRLQALLSGRDDRHSFSVAYYACRNAGGFSDRVALIPHGEAMADCAALFRPTLSTVHFWRSLFMVKARAARYGIGVRAVHPDVWV